MKRPEFDPAWPDDVQALYRHDMREIWDKAIAPQIWNQYHNQLELYCQLSGEGGPLDILDVGCAQGTLALMLAERGHKVTAIDIRQHFLDYAVTRYERGDVRFLCANALEADFEARFDLIFANQIVEHLVYPLELVKRLAEWLKPKGRLIVTTPNFEYLKNSLPSFDEIGNPEKVEHLQFSADADGHFFAYRAGELVEIFTRAGLSDVQSGYFETPWISGHMKLRYLHSVVPPIVLRALDRLTLRAPGLGRQLAHQLIVSGVHA